MLKAPIRRAVRSNWMLMRAAARWRRLSGRAPARGLVGMFHVGRCGSTVLAQLLGQHPEIQWAGELFDNIWAKVPAFKPGKTNWVRAVTEFGIYSKRCAYAGFETKVMNFGSYGLDMGVPDYVRLLRAMGFEHFIVLTRSNLLRIVASALVAARLGQLHVRSQPAVATAISLNPDAPFGTAWGGSLLNMLETFERFYAQLDAPLAGARRLDLNYEADIEQDPIVAYRKVCAYLEITPENPGVSWKRTNPFAVSQMIANYDEVAAAIRGTRFEWMLTA